MRALADAKYRVAAVDLRGYNLSDKPKGVENYDDAAAGRRHRRRGRRPRSRQGDHRRPRLGRRRRLERRDEQAGDHASC